jgi:hypothetical protein
MRIHDIGPRIEVDYPGSRRTRWAEDYDTQRPLELDRPYFDDQPADRFGWEAGSPWGSRPVRDSRSVLSSKSRYFWRS